MRVGGIPLTSTEHSIPLHAMTFLIMLVPPRLGSDYQQFGQEQRKYRRTF